MVRRMSLYLPVSMFYVIRIYNFVYKYIRFSLHIYIYKQKRFDAAARSDDLSHRRYCCITISTSITISTTTRIIIILQPR